MALIKSHDTDSPKGSKDYRYYSQQSSDPATNISKYIYLNKKNQHGVQHKAAGYGWNMASYLATVNALQNSCII